MIRSEETLHARCGPFESAALFSKPELSLQPADVFEGERFKLSCSVIVSVPDRIGDTLRYSFYKDNVRIPNSSSSVNEVHRSENGNYTCKAQASSASGSFIKESSTLLVEAKGASEKGWRPL